MENINTALWKARVVGFFSDAGLLGIFSLMTLIASPEFAALVSEHFGTGISGSLILLALSGGLKHLRNKAVIQKAQEKFGAEGMPDEPIVLL